MRNLIKTISEWGHKHNLLLTDMMLLLESWNRTRDNTKLDEFHLLSTHSRVKGAIRRGLYTKLSPPTCKRGWDWYTMTKKSWDAILTLDLPRTDEVEKFFYVNDVYQMIKSYRKNPESVQFKNPYHSFNVQFDMNDEAFNTHPEIVVSGIVKKIKEHIDVGSTFGEIRLEGKTIGKWHFQRRREI